MPLLPFQPPQIQKICRKIGPSRADGRTIQQPARLTVGECGVGKGPVGRGWEVGWSRRERGGAVVWRETSTSQCEYYIVWMDRDGLAWAGRPVL